MWYENHATLVAFGRVMTKVDGWGAEEVLDYFEEPWKWEPEHTDWSHRGRPHGPEDDGWELFVKAMEKL
jgi:hypothetical protein